MIDRLDDLISRVPHYRGAILLALGALLAVALLAPGALRGPDAPAPIDPTGRANEQRLAAAKAKSERSERRRERRAERREAERREREEAKEEDDGGEEAPVASESPAPSPALSAPAPAPSGGGGGGGGGAGGGEFSVEG